MDRRDIPNLITVFRFLLVPPVVWFILEERHAAALLVFGVAGFSDALDGFLAKRMGWTSRLGGLLDPLADKLLLVSAFVALGWLHLVPWWVLAPVVARDVLIVGGATVYHLRIARLEATPSLISKINTGAQILLVIALLFTHAVWSLPPLLLDALIYTVLVTTLWSGVDYVWTWSRRARRSGARP